MKFATPNIWPTKWTSQLFKNFGTCSIFTQFQIYS